MCYNYETLYMPIVMYILFFFLLLTAHNLAFMLFILPTFLLVYFEINKANHQ